MILIISFEDNEHVRQVTQHLTTDYAIADVAWFPSQMFLSAQTSRETDTLFLSLPDQRQIDLCDVQSIWYRRIRNMTIDPALQDRTSQLFAWSESNEALLGAWYSLDCFWMNHPLADEAALRKIHQLRLARKVGLSIPETLVTNAPPEALAFIDRFGPGNVIRKAFRNIAEAPKETAIVQQTDLSVIDSVSFAPVIFQNFIPAELDLRVTVIDGEIFAASIRSDEHHKADYRPGLSTATVEKYALPETVSTQLLTLMDALNLKFGAVDFRVTPAGEHIFLEVNPAGEFLFISERTGHPIPAAIAASLERQAC
ncbi:MAG: hypothetical protein F6K42_02750 [Leptolyngbya sp. SIO1D8]|nr:hypothetical protein [Leptolyngbya sp. SIO1D8]